MRTGIYLSLAIVAACSMFTVSTARAQDVVVPMPGDYVAPDSAPPPEQIPDASALLQDDGSVVVVPIPGGGEILVEGPASESAASMGPLEHWATLRNNPFSVGTGPIGPIAPAR